MRCFVIGPIGDTASQVRTDADDFMKLIVAPVVSDLGYEPPIRADGAEKREKPLKLLQNALQSLGKRPKKTIVNQGEEGLLWVSTQLYQPPFNLSTSLSLLNVSAVACGAPGLCLAR
jgi:hypothetical protein